MTHRDKQQDEEVEEVEEEEQEQKEESCQWHTKSSVIYLFRVEPL